MNRLNLILTGGFVLSALFLVLAFVELTREAEDNFHTFLGILCVILAAGIGWLTFVSWGLSRV